MPTFPAHDNALPVLSIVYNAPGAQPVVVNLYPDWEKTGECHIGYNELPDLIETCRLLTFVVDAAADEVWEAQKLRAKRKASEEGDIPF